jgi:hypothetical protein
LIATHRDEASVIPPEKLAVLFVSRGAKLIIYHSWGDTNVPPRLSVNYLPEGAAGYAVYEAEGIDAAIALAARFPAARLGGAVEIRPAEKVL